MSEFGSMPKLVIGDRVRWLGPIDPGDAAKGTVLTVSEDGETADIQWDDQTLEEAQNQSAGLAVLHMEKLN